MRKYRAPLLCMGCGWNTLCGKLGDNLWVIYDNPKWTGSLHSSSVRGGLATAECKSEKVTHG